MNKLALHTRLEIASHSYTKDAMNSIARIISITKNYSDIQASIKSVM
jgi:hypothetical protein